MIAAIMKEIKNHFARSVEAQAFEIVSDGIVGSFSEKYIAGMYIWIKNSFLNDGVYLLTGATTSKLSVAPDTFTAENLGDTIYVFASTPPKDFLALVTEIEAYNSGSGTKDGISSESIDDYSVSFGKGDGSWKSVFSQRLNNYRKMWDDDEDISFRQLNWQNRDSGCY